MMPFTRNLTSLLAGCGLIATMGAVPSVVAADEVAPDHAALILAQSQSFDDQTIEAVAAAQAEIQEIRIDLQSRMQNTQNVEELQQMRQRATEEMGDAIRAQGLSIDEYNNFMEAANQNPALIDRLNDAMSDMSG